MSVPIRAYIATSSRMLVIEPVGTEPLPRITGVNTDPSYQVSVTAVGGSFALNVSGQVATIPAQALGSLVQSRLAALSSLAGWPVSVQGNNPYLIRFTRTTSVGALPTLVADGTQLTTAVPSHPVGTIPACWANAFWGYQVDSDIDWTGIAFSTGGDIRQGTRYLPANGSGLHWARATLSGITGTGLVTISASFYSATYLQSHGNLGRAPATAARYHFWDGADIGTAIYRGSKVVNQATATSQDNAWVPIANVYCASGTILVELRDDADANGPVLLQLLNASGYQSGAGVTEPSDSIPAASVASSTIGGGEITLTVSGSTQTISNWLYEDPTDPAGYGTCSLFAPLSAVPRSAATSINVPPGVVGLTSGVSAGLSGTIPNYAGQQRLPLPTDYPTRNMDVGYQIYKGDFYSGHILPANLVKVGSQDWAGSNADTYGTNLGGFNDDDYPTSAAPEAVRRTLCQMLDVAVLAAPYNVQLPGPKTLLWDGTGDAGMEPSGSASVAEVVGSRSLTGITNNRRVFNASGFRNGGFKIYVDTSGGRTISNVRVFDGYVQDPLNPPEFHPVAEGRLASCRVFRHKDLTWNDAGGSLCNWADFPPETGSGYQAAPTSRQVPVVGFSSINSGPYCRNGNYQLVVTTSRAHGWQPGQWIEVQKPNTGGYHTFYSHTIHYADSTTAINVPVWGMVYPLTATTAIVLGAIENKAIITTDLTGQGIFGIAFQGQCPAGLPGRLRNRVGGDCKSWYSIPHGATDDLVVQWIALILTQYPTGLPIYFEYSNEPWNFSPGYPQSVHMQLMGKEFSLQRQALGDSTWENNPTYQNVWWYTLRSGQIAKIVRTAWVAAGRDPSLLRFVLNGPAAFAGRSIDYLDYAAAHDTQGRAANEAGYSGSIISLGQWLIGVSRYWSPGLVNASQASGFDALTLDQVLDIVEAQAEHYASGQWAAIDANLANALATLHPGVGWTIYEAGPQAIAFSGTQSINDARTLVATLHPRFGPAFLYHVRHYESLGVPTYVKYGFAGPFVIETGGWKSYYAYLGIDQKASPGDGTLGGTDNRPFLVDGSGQPISLDPTKVDSVVGWAIDAWNQAAATPPPPDGEGWSTVMLVQWAT